MVKDKLAIDVTPRGRFKRLASLRTQSVLDRLRVLGNCSNPYLYEYSDEETRLIFKAIEDELKALKTKFVKKRGQRFSLN